MVATSFGSIRVGQHSVILPWLRVLRARIKLARDAALAERWVDLRHDPRIGIPPR